MSTPEVEIVPLTDDQKAAIRECRFCFVNVVHTIAWAYTYDEQIAARAPGGYTTFVRARDPQTRQPTHTEYEIQMAHPHALELVIEIQDERKAA